LATQVAEAEAELSSGPAGGPADDAHGVEPAAVAARDTARATEEQWRAAVAGLAGADDAQLAAEEALAAARELHSQLIAATARQHELQARSQARRERIERELAAAQAAARAAEAELGP